MITALARVRSSREQQNKAVMSQLCHIALLSHHEKHQHDSDVATIV